MGREKRRERGREGRRGGGEEGKGEIVSYTYHCKTLVSFCSL